jgi:hypothetical protein
MAADRFDRTLVMIAADAVRATAVAGLGAAILLDGVEPGTRRRTDDRERTWLRRRVWSGWTRGLPR